MISRVLSILVRTAAAAAGSALGVAASMWLLPYLGTTPFAPLYLSTFAAAWRGGFVPGLVAAGIAATAAPPRLGLARDAAQVLTQQLALGFLLGLTAVIVAALSWSARRHRERFASTLASIGDAVVVTDRGGQVTYLNPAAESLLGWPVNDARGRVLEEVAPLADEGTGEPESIHLDAVLRDGRTLTISPGLVALTRGGNRAPIEGTTSPMRDVKGRTSGAVVVLRDITVRHDAERERLRLAREVAAGRERLQQIMAGVPSIIWEASGPSGSGAQHLRFVSPYVETLTAFTADEALAIPNFWLERTHPDDRDTVAQRTAALYQGGQSAAMQFRWRTKDDRELWLESLSFVVRDARGRPVGLRGVTIDITSRMQEDAERNSLLARERQARQDAEDANRLKDEFLMTLSHELRTPLNAILGWACLLRDGSLSTDKQRRALETIERNARAQTQLIEDLLDMSRIVTGQVRLEVGAVDIETVVQGVVEAMRPGAEAKGVRLDLVADADIERIPGDANRIQQVIWNLVSNALKFTPAGGRVEVRVRPLYDRVLVAVSDTGIGIAPDLLPYIFERFRQGSQGSGGLGLGLAIAKQLVELHGGTIEARSLGENMGATFLVRLPLFAQRPAHEVRTGSTRGMADRREGAPEVDLSGVRILVVDAAPDSRELVQLMLEQTGATVATAGTARDALALVRSWAPHALLSDLSLPNDDSVDLIGELRGAEARERRSPLPAVAVGSLLRGDEVRVALESGYDLHVAKPVTASELVGAIQSVLRRERRGSAGGTVPTL